MIDDVDTDQILISNKIASGRKGYEDFTGYKDDDYEIKLLCMIFPKLTEYLKSVDETKHMYFLIKNDVLLRQYNKI